MSAWQTMDSAPRDGTHIQAEIPGNGADAADAMEANQHKGAVSMAERQIDWARFVLGLDEYCKQLRETADRNLRVASNDTARMQYGVALLLEGIAAGVGHALLRDEPIESKERS